MKNVKSLFQLLIVSCAITPVAAPYYLYHATYGIDDILLNCEFNGWMYRCYSTSAKMYADEGGTSYWQGAQIYATQTYSYNKPHYIRCKDQQVTFDAICNIGPSGSYQYRETADFVVYGGHAGEYGPVLGDKPGYGLPTPSDLRMGGSWNRWFINHGCETLQGLHDFVIARWSPLFNGLQVMLGFASFGWINENVGTVFWKYWTGNGNQAAAYPIYCAWWLAVSEMDSRNMSAGVIANDIYRIYDTYYTATNNPSPAGAMWLFRYETHPVP